MANQDSPLWERLGMDHDLSPPLTLLNMVNALKFRLFIIPPEQQTLKRNKNLSNGEKQGHLPKTVMDP